MAPPDKPPEIDTTPAADNVANCSRVVSECLPKPGSLNELSHPGTSFANNGHTVPEYKEHLPTAKVVVASNGNKSPDAHTQSRQTQDRRTSQTAKPLTPEEQNRAVVNVLSPRLIEGLGLDQARVTLDAIQEDLKTRGYDPRQHLLGYGTERGNKNNPFVNSDDLYRPDARRINLEVARRESQKRSLGPLGLDRLTGEDSARRNPFSQSLLEMDPNSIAARTRRNVLSSYLDLATPEQRKQFAQLLDIEKEQTEDPKMHWQRSLEARLREPLDQMSPVQQRVFDEQVSLQRVLRLGDYVSEHIDQLEKEYSKHHWQPDSQWFGVDDKKFLEELHTRSKNSYGISDYDKFRALATIDGVKEQNPDLFKAELDMEKHEPKEAFTTDGKLKPEYQMRQNIDQLEKLFRMQLTQGLQLEISKVEVALYNQQQRQGWISGSADSVIGHLGKSGGWGGMFMDSDATSQATGANLERARKAAQQVQALPEFKGNNLEFARAYQERTSALGRSLLQVNDNLIKMIEAHEGRIEGVSDIVQVTAAVGTTMACCAAAPTTFGGSLAAIPVLAPMAAGAAGKVLPKLLEYTTSANGDAYTLPNMASDAFLASLMSAPFLPGNQIAKPLLQLETTTVKQIALAEARQLALTEGGQLAVQTSQRSLVQRTVQVGRNLSTQLSELTPQKALEFTVKQSLNTGKHALGYATAGGIDGASIGASRAIVKGEDPVQAAIQGLVGGAIMGPAMGPAIKLAGNLAKKGVTWLRTKTDITVDNSRLNAAIADYNSRQAQPDIKWKPESFKYERPPHSGGGTGNPEAPTGLELGTNTELPGNIIRSARGNGAVPPHLLEVDSLPTNTVARNPAKQTTHSPHVMETTPPSVGTFHGMTPGSDGPGASYTRPVHVSSSASKPATESNGQSGRPANGESPQSARASNDNAHPGGEPAPHESKSASAREQQTTSGNGNSHRDSLPLEGSSAADKSAMPQTCSQRAESQVASRIRRALERVKDPNGQTLAQEGWVIEVSENGSARDHIKADLVVRNTKTGDYYTPDVTENRVVDGRGNYRFNPDHEGAKIARSDQHLDSILERNNVLQAADSDLIGSIFKPANLRNEAQHPLPSPKAMGPAETREAVAKYQAGLESSGNPRLVEFARDLDGALNHLDREVQAAAVRARVDGTISAFKASGAYDRASDNLRTAAEDMIGAAARKHIRNSIDSALQPGAKAQGNPGSDPLFPAPSLSSNSNSQVTSPGNNRLQLTTKSGTKIDCKIDPKRVETIIAEEWKRAADTLERHQLYVVDRLRTGTTQLRDALANPNAIADIAAQMEGQSQGQLLGADFTDPLANLNASGSLPVMVFVPPASPKPEPTIKIMNPPEALQAGNTTQSAATAPKPAALAQEVQEARNNVARTQQGKVNATDAQNAREEAAGQNGGRLTKAEKKAMMWQAIADREIKSAEAKTNAANMTRETDAQPTNGKSELTGKETDGKAAAEKLAADKARVAEVEKARVAVEAARTEALKQEELVRANAARVEAAREQAARVAAEAEKARVAEAEKARVAEAERVRVAAEAEKTRVAAEAEKARVVAAQKAAADKLAADKVRAEATAKAAQAKPEAKTQPNPTSAPRANPERTSPTARGDNLPRTNLASDRIVPTEDVPTKALHAIAAHAKRLSVASVGSDGQVSPDLRKAIYSLITDEGHRLAPPVLFEVKRVYGLYSTKMPPPVIHSINQSVKEAMAK